MEIFKIEFTVIIVFHLTVVAISEELEIFRTRTPGEDGWRHGTDSFQIPPSLCSQGGMKCAQFSASTEQQCSCSCPNSDATFLFDNNDWKCLNNAHVRRLLGYDSSKFIVFDSERLHNPLRLININDNKRISLSPNLKNCQVDVGSSWLIGCNGSEPFNTNSDVFTVVPDGDPIDLPPYFLKVTGSSAADTKLLEGRIIKLGIVCSGSINRWLLFKFVGSLKCLSPTLPPTVTTKAQDRTVKLLPSKGPGVVGNTVIDMKIMKITPSASLSTPVISVTIPTGFLTPTTVSDVRPTVTDVRPTAPTRNGREQGSDDSSSWGLIAGLTASILFVIIIVGLLVYRRVYLNKFNQPPPLPTKSVKRKNTNEVSTQSCASHEPDGEDGYRALDIRHPSIYAASYQIPFHDSTRPVYASLNFPVEHNTCGHGDTLDSDVYNDPDYDSELRSKNKGPGKGPIRLEQPVYDAMEELSLRRAKGLVQAGDNDSQSGSEPEQDKTLEPYLKRSKLPSQYFTMSAADAVFNTLEKSYPNEETEANDPEYTNVPVYHVLEKVPHPGVHASVKGYSTRNL